jgi:DNA polymerase III delta prime subunit
MSTDNQEELIAALRNNFDEASIPAVKNDINYEDLRSHLALYLKTLMRENRTLLYACLYRIDVSENDVRMAMNQNLSEYILAELILKKLNEKLYWRNKYKKNNE